MAKNILKNYFGPYFSILYSLVFLSAKKEGSYVYFMIS